MGKPDTILFPSLLGQTRGNIVQWYVEMGDYVNSGDSLVEVDIGEVTCELESYVEGTVLYLGAERGQRMSEGYLLAIIGEPGTDIEPIINKSAENYLDKQADQDAMKGYLGEIKMYAGNNLLRNWAICDGTELLISDYPELYEVIGSKFGGNGYKTFKIPNIPDNNQVFHIICIDGEIPT